jgi:hypothetical protein
MRPYILGILVCMWLCSQAQSEHQKDSLIQEMCKTLVAHEHLSDSDRVMLTYEKHLFPFMLKYPEDKHEEIGTHIYFRLQRSCQVFQDILYRVEGYNGDLFLYERPVSNLNRKSCRNFTKNRTYQYIESTGDTVLLKLTDKYWVDHFKDGTFSRLSLKWIADCEFEITFIESNNLIRKNFSIPGDRYRYIVLAEQPGFYEISAQIVGREGYYVYKIYR